MNRWQQLYDSSRESARKGPVGKVQQAASGNLPLALSMQHWDLLEVIPVLHALTRGNIDRSMLYLLLNEPTIYTQMFIGSMMKL